MKYLDFLAYEIYISILQIVLERIIEWCGYIIHVANKIWNIIYWTFFTFYKIKNHETISDDIVVVFGVVIS